MVILEVLTKNQLSSFKIKLEIRFYRFTRAWQNLNRAKVFFLCFSLTICCFCPMEFSINILILIIVYFRVELRIIKSRKYSKKTHTLQHDRDHDKPNSSKQRPIDIKINCERNMQRLECQLRSYCCSKIAIKCYKYPRYTSGPTKYGIIAVACRIKNQKKKKESEIRMIFYLRHLQHFRMENKIDAAR